MALNASAEELKKCAMPGGSNLKRWRPRALAALSLRQTVYHRRCGIPSCDPQWNPALRPTPLGSSAVYARKLFEDTGHVFSFLLKHSTLYQITAANTATFWNLMSSPLHSPELARMRKPLFLAVCSCTNEEIPMAKCAESRLCCRIVN